MPSETEKALECLKTWWEARFPLVLHCPKAQLVGALLVYVSREELKFHWADSTPEGSPFVHGWGDVTIDLTGKSLALSRFTDNPSESDPDFFMSGNACVTVAPDGHNRCTVRLMQI